jgi:hypothetical protein
MVVEKHCIAIDNGASNGKITVRFISYILKINEKLVKRINQ